MSNYFTYILELNDNTFYIGYTNNLTKRLLAHNEGTASKRTRGRTPIKLCYYEVYNSKNEAMSREWHLKKLTREQKKKLVDSKLFTILD